jgi:hypothetical protein
MYKIVVALIIEEEGKKRLAETTRKKNQGKEPSGAQIANNWYVIVATSLTEVEPVLIMELYRYR